ncbi:MAG: DUF4388 domain-containing protein [Acidobacteriota bacterium]
MGLNGNLDTMLLADLLQWLSLGQKTGTLHVSTPQRQRRIYFKEGRVIASASTDPAEYLSGFLMSQGYVTREQLDKAIKAQGQSKMLLGKILVMIDSISEQDLLRLMRIKAEEEIYDLFLWKEGEFEFIDNELPTMDMVPLQIDLTGVIMEGTRRQDEWKRIEHLIPSRSSTPIIESPVDQDTLSEVQKLILQCVNGHRTIDQIISESHSPLFLVGTTLAELNRDGAVRFLPPQEESPPPVPQPPPAPFRPEDEIESLLGRAKEALNAGEYEQSIRLLKAAQNLDPSNKQVINTFKGAETVITSQLKKEGISLSKIPRVTQPMESITEMDFSPNEGFILSRINGIWDIGSIVKISPLRESEALLIFHRLLKAGIIEL